MPTKKSNGDSGLHRILHERRYKFWQLVLAVIIAIGGVALWARGEVFREIEIHDVAANAHPHIQVEIATMQSESEVRDDRITELRMTNIKIEQRLERNGEKLDWIVDHIKKNGGP